jgi:DhnA family fructose-bisphosphate aldolase class Ia
MGSAEDARRLLEYAHRRTLGGNILKANYIGNNNSNVNDVMSAFRRSELTSMTDATNASGCSVIVSGLPTRTRPEHLLGYLRSRNFFPVEGAPDNVLQLKT